MDYFGYERENEYPTGYRTYGGYEEEPLNEYNTFYEDEE